MQSSIASTWAGAESAVAQSVTPTTPIQPDASTISTVPLQPPTQSLARPLTSPLVDPSNVVRLATHAQSGDGETAKSDGLTDVVKEVADAKSGGGNEGEAETLPAPQPVRDFAADAKKDDARDAAAGRLDDGAVPTESVTLEDVLISATETFPAIREAALLRTLAIGNQISAMGEFDDKIEAHTIGQPLGFYENYRSGIDWKKPLVMGGYSFLGYRAGRGDFEPWYGERETDDGGEFKAGFDIPVLQNRAIDPRRTAVRLASLDIQRASPELFQQVLTTQYEAAEAYWMWFAATKQYTIAQELMTLAEERVDSIEAQIKIGDVAPMIGIDNRRLLAMRRAKLVESRQKLDTSAIKLSLYYRDDLGRPVRPTISAQPKDFPPLPMEMINIDAEISRAFSNRPELAIFRVVEDQLRTELSLAINQRLPDLAFGSAISQDVGGLASPRGDKQPFKLEAGLIGSVPVQRRKAIGKAQALRAKIGQLDAKRQLTGDKIANEVRVAVTIYEAAKLRLEQARLTRDLGAQSLNFGEIQFASGDIDILLLNIIEQAFADAGVEVIIAQADLLTAEAMLIVATGRSLLEEGF